MAVGISNFPTSLDAASDLVEATNNASTQINMGIPGLSNTETTITVLSTLAFPSTGIIRINNELISYSAKTATTFTVQTRGFESTIAANHANGSTVSLDITAASNNAKNSAIIALETKVGTGSSTPTANTVLRGTGTGTSAFGQVGLTTDVTGTLPVANGGTGASSLTANNVLLGNGTSAVQVVAPGTSGNVLTSNGTTWSSQPGTFGIVRTNGLITLTASSPPEVFLTDTTVNIQDVRLPDVTAAGFTVGRRFTITNESAACGAVCISTGTRLNFLARGQRVVATCISTANNNASSWYIAYDNFLLNPAGAENYLINSAFRVDQRLAGASRTVTTGSFQFVADRWQAQALGASVTVSATVLTGLGGLTVIGTASNTGTQLRQRIEQRITNNLNEDQAGSRTVTLSFEYAATDGVSTTFSYAINYASPVDNFSTTTPGPTGNMISQPISNGPALRMVSGPISISSTGGIEVIITLPALTAAQNITIRNIKLEPGPFATPYVSVPYDLELARCQLQLNLLEQSTSPYTFTLNDIGQLVSSTSSNAFIFSIPTNASVAFPVGSQINVVRTGTGQVTIQAATSGTTTINSTGATATAPTLRARYSAATCIKTATDTWLVIGDIA